MTFGFDMGLPRRASAFTLVEVVIAVGLTAATVLTVFALLLPARDSSREAALAAAAIRLQPALELDLQDRGMKTIFENVSGGEEAIFGLYQVKIRGGGTGVTPAPRDLETSPEGTLGAPFSVITVVRDLADVEEISAAESELDALEGVVFVVRLGLDIGDEIQKEIAGESFSDFSPAVLVLSAEFIEVPSNVPLSEWGDLSARRRPVLSLPISVRR